MPRKAAPALATTSNERLAAAAAGCPFHRRHPPRSWRKRPRPEIASTTRTALKRILYVTVWCTQAPRVAWGRGGALGTAEQLGWRRATVWSPFEPTPVDALSFPLWCAATVPYVQYRTRSTVCYHVLYVQYHRIETLGARLRLDQVDEGATVASGVAAQAHGREATRARPQKNCLGEYYVEPIAPHAILGMSVAIDRYPTSSCCPPRRSRRPQRRRPAPTRCRARY